MFKRIRWVSVGAMAGLGGSFWAQRRVRRAVGRYLPEQVSAEVADRARVLRADLLDAFDEGRRAMHDRELELRSQLPGPGGHQQGPAGPGGHQQGPAGPGGHQQGPAGPGGHQQGPPASERPATSRSLQARRR